MVRDVGRRCTHAGTNQERCWARSIALLVFAVVALLTAPARAQKAVPVFPDQPRVSLARHIEVFEDDTHHARFADVQHASFRAPRLQTDKWAHLGRSKASVWVRFRLSNPSPRAVRVVLQPTAPFVDSVELYAPGKGLLSRTGDAVPRQDRAYGGVTPRFDLELQPRSTSTYYLRIDTTGNLLLPMTLQESREFDARMESEQLFTGGVLGLLLVTAGFFFLTFLTSRRRAYALYSLHVLASMAFIAAVQGLVQVALPLQNAYWTYAFVLLTDLTGLLFLRAFLDTRRTRPKLDRLLVVLGITIALCTLWVLVRGEKFQAQAFVHVLVSGIAVVQAATAVFEGLHGPRSRQLYAFSWVVYFVTRFISSLAVAGFVPVEGLDPIGWMMVSYAGEAILTGLALVARIREDQLALAESERRLADLIRESPDGIVLFYAGRCVATNPAAEQILKRNATDLEGKSIGNLGFSSDCQEQLDDALKDALGGGVGATRAVALAGDDDTVRYVDANFRKFGDHAGAALVQMTLRDVSERVLAERTSRLAEARAQKAERLEAIGRLAGGVAHDFNNILTVILGNAELLKLQSASEEAQQIILAAQTAKGLTTQLLTFSKHDAAIGTAADLKHVIQDSQALLRPLLSEKIDLQLELDDDLPRVRGDAGQLQQVLMNLCINSRDAMPEGGTVTVRARAIGKQDGARQNTPATGVRLSVVDTGAGMDEATQQRAFEPFFSTKDKGRGTGLGLATVFGIVRASGGDIRLTSSPGHGTRVEIELCAAKDQESPENVQSLPPSKSAPGKLLLVEDQADVLRVMSKVLESAGHEVKATNSPDEALDFATRGQRVDVIVTDVVMPGMDGPALARRLTELLGPVPVLYVSGYMPDQVGHDLELGVNCLRKPVKATQLLSHVASLLQNHRRDGSSAARA